MSTLHTNTPRFDTVPILIVATVVLFLGMGSACRETDPNGKKAGAVPPAKTGKLPDSIGNAGSNAVLALVALDKKFAALQAEYDALKLSSAKASAQIGSANIANTNQPPGPATQVVDRETKLAMTNLPPQDVTEALEAARRRLALMENRIADADALYKTASTEAERMKTEMAQLKDETEKARVEGEAQRQKAAAAQAALVAAEKQQAAELEKNRAANQAKLDEANKKADAAVQKAYEENQKTIVWILVGIGGLCILAGIGLAIATQGTSLVRSGIAVACGGVCFGLAKVISHPWFNTVFIASLVLLAVCGGAYMWYEWKCSRELKEGKVIKETAEQLVQVMDAHGVAVTKGEVTPVGAELRGKMDKAHKLAIRKLRLANEAKATV